MTARMVIGSLFLGHYIGIRNKIVALLLPDITVAGWEG